MSKEFYGHSFSVATAYWCDACGCLATFDTNVKGKEVADRFEYASDPDGPYPGHDCICHGLIEKHNAAVIDHEA